MKKQKLLTRTVMAVVAVAAAVYGYRWWNGTDEGTEASSRAITLAKIERGDMRQEVPCNGRVVSNLDVEIKCRASGEIIKLPFDVSDTVKKGDLLMELDPVDQQRIVQQREVTLSASEARLAQAKSTLKAAEQNLAADRIMAAAAVESALARANDASAKAKREEQLFAKKYSSEEFVETAQTTAMQAKQDYNTAVAQVEALKAQEADLETRRQEIKLAEAQIENDRIALSLAKLQLDYTKVYSPIDGVVSDRQVEIGQIIASGINNVGGGTAVLMLSDLSRIFILASVDESDIGSIAIDQPAEITVDAFPGKSFTGRVDRIAAKGVNLQNVVTFEVRIEVEGENKTLLKPEMTTNVTIVVADKSGVLTIPYNAVARERGKAYTVLAKADGSEGEKVPIELGITNGEAWEVVSGVNEGDTVTVQRAEVDSEWNRDGGGANSARGRMMMMRTMGGGGRGR
ncbi:MAG: efflux RND transporter periplasmic adaptor subunit [Candidatus Hydrogenedentes bacterium]|nr:efflux RND transporter periplasmic adaptor subunit [Candidatus Hydrogenedentota bacterium]